MKGNIIITGLLIILGLFFVILQPVYAQLGSMMNDEKHGESVEVVLSQLLSQKQVSTIQELDCKLISSNDFERLGDAVMEQQHPGQAHEVMDQMMGGEGSESLKQMHINMGSNYLGCSGSSTIGMMGKGMMNGGGFSMMGYGSNMMSGYSIFGGLTWIVLITFLLSGIYFFIKQANKKKVG